MGKRMAKHLFMGCFCLFVCVAICATHFLVLKSRETISNAVVVAENMQTKDSYIGKVDNPLYMEKYKNDSEWIAISTGEELKNFLTNNNDLSDKNGYLTNNVTFNWSDISLPPYLASNVNNDTGYFDKIFDGCGFEITFDCVPFTSHGEKGNCLVVSDKNHGEKTINNNTDMHAFGVLANGLSGTMKNFVLNIENTLYFKEKNVNTNKEKVSAMGTVAGYLTATGVVENVAVNFASSVEKFGFYSDKDIIGNQKHAFAYLGGLVGVSRGKIENCQVTISNDTKLDVELIGFNQNATSQDRHVHARLGGVVGKIEQGIVDRVVFVAENLNKGGLQTTAKYEGTGTYLPETDAYSGFVCAINDGAQVKSVMVKGTPKAFGYTKNDLFVNSLKGKGDGQCEFGYVVDGNTENVKSNNNGKEKAINITTNANGASVNFDKNNQDKMQLFAPDGKILWKPFGVENLYSLQEMQSISVLPPIFDAKIDLGELKQGEVGFFDGDTKVSGEVEYNGKAYQIKMLVDGELKSGENVKVECLGDLINASKNQCVLTLKSDVAYIDEENKFVVTKQNLQGLESKLAIKPKTLTTSFEGASTNVLANKNVSYSGLCGNDKVTINGTQYGNGQAFSLTSAGNVTINAPSNNYKLENNEQTRTITVNAVDVLVEKGITIRNYNLTEASEPNMQKLTLNSYVASLDLEANYNAYGQKYDGFVVVGGGELTAKNYTNTLLKATLATTENLSSIKFGALQIQTFKVTGDIVKDVTFGEKVDYTADLEKDGQIFDGWSVDNVIVSYAMQFSIRVTKNTNIVATYKNANPEDIYTHIFLDSNGNQYKTVKNARPNMLGHEGFALPNQLSWDFSRWQIAKVEDKITTYKPIFVYDESVGLKVSITKDGKTEQVEYNRMFTLAEGTYIINGTSVTVGVEGLSLFATSDMVITKDGEQTKEVSAKVNKFENQGMHYMASTYVASDGKQIENMALKLESTSGKVFYVFIDKYTKIGNNIYQSVYKFSDATLDQAFGTEQITVTPVINNVEEVGETFVLREARV